MSHNTAENCRFDPALMPFPDRFDEQRSEVSREQVTPFRHKRDVILDFHSSPDAILNALHQAGWRVTPIAQAQRSEQQECQVTGGSSRMCDSAEDDLLSAQKLDLSRLREHDEKLTNEVRKRVLLEVSQDRTATGHASKVEKIAVELKEQLAEVERLVQGNLTGCGTCRTILRLISEG